MNEQGGNIEPTTQRVQICGLPFSKITQKRVVDEIEARMIQRPLFVSLTAVDPVVMAQSDASLREVYGSFDYLLADGMPLIWASRFLGAPLPERIAGPDLLVALLARSRERNYAVFFLGSDESTMKQAKDRALHEGVRVCGHYCPPMMTKPGRAEEARMCEAVERAQPDLLFVVLGAPKQDRWIHENRHRIAARVTVTVGAAFDWYAGRLWRVPFWMQRLGLEWVGRVIQNPALWRRYARDLMFPIFVFRQRRQGLQSTRRGSSTDAASRES